MLSRLKKLFQNLKCNLKSSCCIVNNDQHHLEIKIDSIKDLEGSELEYNIGGKKIKISFI